MRYFPASLDGDAVDFLETGQTVLHLLKPGPPEIPHAFLRGLIGDLHRAPGPENDTRHGVCYREHLIDTYPPLVAIDAVVAALGPKDLQTGPGVRLGEALLEERFLRYVQRLFALIAQTPRESLGDDQVHGGRDRVWLDPHVHQSGESLRRIICVQRRENEMPRLCRLDGDLGGLEVTDLTHHDHVRVLAQERTHRRREGESYLGVDVDLIHSRKVDFRRVFGGRDV